MDDMMKTTWKGRCPKCKTVATFKGEDNVYTCPDCDMDFSTNTEVVAKPIVFKPRSVKDIPNEEKIKKFDELYASALDHYNDVISGGDPDDDTSHYMYEEMMGLLGGEEMWKSFNDATD
jgi:hypothetical protein